MFASEAMDVLPSCFHIDSRIRGCVIHRYTSFAEVPLRYQTTARIKTLVLADIANAFLPGIVTASVKPFGQLISRDATITARIENKTIVIVNIGTSALDLLFLLKK